MIATSTIIKSYWPIILSIVRTIAGRFAFAVVSFILAKYYIFPGWKILVAFFILSVIMALIIIVILLFLSLITVFIRFSWSSVFCAQISHQ